MVKSFSSNRNMVICVIHKDEVNLKFGILKLLPQNFDVIKKLLENLFDNFGDGSVDIF